MTDRNELLKTFVDAALAMMQEGLSKLPIERALYVAQAQKMGADVAIVFAPGAGSVVGALHDPDGNVLELFKVMVPLPEVSTN